MLERSPMKPRPGRTVLYRNRYGSLAPAVILRTRESTNLEAAVRFKRELAIQEREHDWVHFHEELPDDVVDLLVHGLDGDYREFGVPYVPARSTPDPTTVPRSWFWIYEVM